MKTGFAIRSMSALALVVALVPGTARARITKIGITSIESPTFGGTLFGVNGSVGRCGGSEQRAPLNADRRRSTRLLDVVS